MTDSENTLSAAEVESIRSQFEILNRQVNRRPLVYLDNTATTQTPRSVVDAVVDMYTHTKANVHRGVHTLSQEATELQETSRRRVAEFINAPSPEQIIFTRGTTESINLVAASYGQSLRDGDEIVLTVMEHHSNIVPWQLIGAHAHIVIRPVGLTPDGSLDMDAMAAAIGPRTRMVAVAHVSNVLGTVNPVAEVVALAHSRGIPVLVDGAQAVAHMRVDVTALDADFYVFSSHKMYGPTGIGVLYGRRELLDKMPPYQGGGEMIERVSFERTTYAPIPFKFEAGTPDYVGIAAFTKALDFIERIGQHRIEAYEESLLRRAMQGLEAIDGLRVYGTAPGKAAIISFTVDGTHTYDLGMLLDKQGVEVRTGHHCAEPLMHYLGIDGTVRASFAVYNTPAEVDAFVAATSRAASMLR